MGTYSKSQIPDLRKRNQRTHQQKLWVIESVKRASAGNGPTNCDIVIRPLNDARTDKAITEAGERSKYRISTTEKLRQGKARRVTISPIGELMCRPSDATGNV